MMRRCPLSSILTRMKQTQHDDVLLVEFVAYLVVADDDAPDLAWRKRGKTLAQARMRGNAADSGHDGPNQTGRGSRVDRLQKFMDPDQITVSLFRPSQGHDRFVAEGAGSQERSGADVFLRFLAGVESLLAQASMSA